MVLNNRANDEKVIGIFKKIYGSNITNFCKLPISKRAHSKKGKNYDTCFF